MKEDEEVPLRSILEFVHCLGLVDQDGPMVHKILPGRTKGKIAKLQANNVEASMMSVLHNFGGMQRPARVNHLSRWVRTGDRLNLNRGAASKDPT